MSADRVRYLMIAGCLMASPAAALEASRPAPPAADALERPRPRIVGFAPIGDVQMYYEIHGAGEPLLFIHGGGGSVHTSWPREYTDELSREFMVIVADSRGHGNTADGAGPITFGRLAADAVRLLDHLGIGRAHVVGHSAGAIAGLHLLLDHPERVRTATLLAGAYHVDNYRPAAYADLKRELEALIRGDTIESRLASKPVGVLRKLESAWLAGPSFTFRQLATISRPTLIVTAGRDIFFEPAVGEDMRAHIPASELLHYPEATHRMQATHSRELVKAIRDFIARRGR
jgi:pimeloyl-ACP methyl ester carboxylesterase